MSGIRVSKPWLYNDFIFYHSKYGKQQKKSKKAVYNFIKAVIDEKINGFGNFKSELSSASTLDYLIAMNETTKELSEEDLFDEMLTLFVAAQEPVTSLSCELLLILAMKQDVQDKVYQELKNIFGDSDRPIIFEDLQKMNYLEMVIKETLRIFSPIALCRTVHEDFELGDVMIPAGCNLLVSPFVTNRLEEHWGQNSKIFDPDRFLPENVSKRHPLAYIPFSAGLRACAGQRYGIMATKTLAAEVLRKFVLFTDQKESTMKILGGLTTRPVGGFKIQIMNRVFCN